jgi:hypothetical protein
MDLLHGRLAFLVCYFLKDLKVLTLKEQLPLDDML